MTPTPDAARWAQIKALFEAVLEAPPGQREALLAAAALDAAGLAEVLSLLAHHEQATLGQVFMAESAASQLSEGAGARAGAARVGQRLGAWEIVRAIGTGGMGEVFEARRADGSYEGRAAVKLLKRGMDSAAVLQRFAQERQALARLSHPHIARLLDAGASADGLPYFVLEFVEGRPIDEAVRGLALERRLGLFLQLADAVVHAHRNLLVHRDLKPGNVLVDGDGQVKLLDFGIAKALDPLDPLDGHDSATTVAGQRPFTPHYASPEQVRGEPVSTATDIYSLGVLLYQMLTGTRPTGRHATTPAQAARSVLEDAPTRPSRLSASEAVDPQWLSTRKRLQGDLDNILLKALEKLPERRYSSVEALAADVQSFIDGRPVAARAASPTYVLGKFMRRNRWAVLAGGLGSLGLATGLAAALLQERAAVAVGVAALAGGLGLALVKGRQADLARAQAEQHVADLRKLCREVVLEYGDAITYVPDGMARKAAMLTATLGQLDRLSAAVGDDPAFRSEVGGLYARLADLQTVDNWNAHERPDDAEHHARRAITLLASAGHANGTDTLLWWTRALCVLAKGAQHRREFDTALAHLAQAEHVVQTGLDRFVGHPALCSEHAAVVMIRASVHYGYNKPNLNQPDAALDVLEQAQAMYLAMTRGPGNVSMEDVFQVAAVAAGRALIFARQERWAQAIDASTQALAQRQQAGDMEPHNRVVQGAVAADHNLHCALFLTVGDVARGLHHGQAAWVALQALVAEDPGNRAWPIQRRNLALNLGRALAASGDAAGALPVLQLSDDGLATAVRDGSATPLQRRRHAQTQAAQAGALHQLAQPDEARALATQAATALQALVQEVGAERDSLMALGECAVCLSGWHDGEQALHWKAQARSAYDEAERMQPLTAEHARRAQWARA